MATQGKTKASQGSKVAVEWVYIRYRTLALIGLALVLVVGGGAGWWFLHGRGPDEKQALQAIASAEKVVGQAAVAAPRSEALATARAHLGNARSAAGSREYRTAVDEASLAEDLAKDILGLRNPGAETAVRVVRADGDVRLKRAGQFMWEEVNERTQLRVGDQVRTGSDSSAQLVYFDGTTMTVSSGTLLEIRDLFRDPQRRTQRITERLAFGTVSASTQETEGVTTVHEVATETASVRARQAAEFEVRFDQSRGRSEVLAFRGPLTLTTGGKEVELPQSTRVTLDQGKIVSKSVLLDPPQLIFPPDQKAFSGQAAVRVEAGWGAVNRAIRYRFQLSDRHLFSQLIEDRDRVIATTAVLPASLPPGVYFWRVAGVDKEGVPGRWSETRKFRLLGAEFKDPADKDPPALDVSEILVVGSNAIITGRAEPGALVWVEGERVEVEDDGRFTWLIKLRGDGRNKIQIVAQDAAGNETRRQGYAYVDAF